MMNTKPEAVEKTVIDIYNIAYGGLGVGRLGQKVCFVEGALPGEQAVIKIINNKKNFFLARVEEIIKPSPFRTAPVCNYYNNCGGCQYQHLDYEKECLFKLQQVNEAMQRIGGFKGFNSQGIKKSKSCLGYRHSVSLHRSKTGYGFFAKDNKTIIDIKECPLAAKEINDCLPSLFEAGKKKNITIKSNTAGSVYVSNQQGSRFYKDTFFNTDIVFSPLAFSQANTAMAACIAGWIRHEAEADKRHTLFELFCGTGFFGILLRDLYESVIGIDNSSIAIDCATLSKKQLGAGNIKFYCADCEKKFLLYFDKFSAKTNTILIDPPRTGLGKGLACILLELKNAEVIYYISCDPAVLARDARFLTKDNKWKIKKLMCFDMFPRTKHIESVAVFTR